MVVHAIKEEDNLYHVPNIYQQNGPCEVWKSAVFICTYEVVLYYICMGLVR